MISQDLVESAKQSIGHDAEIIVDKVGDTVRILTTVSVDGKAYTSKTLMFTKTAYEHADVVVADLVHRTLIRIDHIKRRDG